MRPSQILLSEKKVTEVVEIFEEEFINPFGVGHEHLYNISSGEEVADDLASEILDVRQNGSRMKEFVRSNEPNCKISRHFNEILRENIQVSG